MKYLKTTRSWIWQRINFIISYRNYRMLLNLSFRTDGKFIFGKSNKNSISAGNCRFYKSVCYSKRKSKRHITKVCGCLIHNQIWERVTVAEGKEPKTGAKLKKWTSPVTSAKREIGLELIHTKEMLGVDNWIALTESVHKNVSGVWMKDLHGVKTQDTLIMAIVIILVAWGSRDKEREAELKFWIGVVSG